MTTKPQQTRFEDWETWFRLCSFEACPEDSQERLADFAQSRLRLFYYDTLKDLGTSPSDAITRSLNEKAYAFLRLEEHLCNGINLEGKTYKEHQLEKLSQYSGPPVSVAQAIMTFAIRGYIAEAFKKETLQQEQLQGAEQIDTSQSDTSLDTEIWKEEHSPAKIYQHLLETSEFSRAETLELTKLASTMAQKLMEQSDIASMVAFLGLSRSVSLAEKEMTDTAKCGKTKLYELSKEWQQRLPRVVNQKFPDEEIFTRQFICFLLAKEIDSWIEKKFIAENIDLSCFFMQDDDELDSDSEMETIK